MSKRRLRIIPIVFFCVFTLLFLAISFAFIRISRDVPSSQGIFTESPTLPTVIIDAGHGGEDGGAVGVNGCLEKDINLSIAKELKSSLESLGVECVLTREDDRLLYDRNVNYEGRKKRLDMLERLRIATSYENAVFVSIHQNSFSQEKYSGLQIYYSEVNEGSRLLADTVSTAVKRTLQADNDRGSKPSDGNIYLLDRLSCPAVLIECGFLSNHAECDLLCTKEYQVALCETMAKAIFSFLSGPYA